MSSDSTALGDRMKGYEAATRYVLPGRTYTIIRVDGRAFHSLLRHAEKPFDHEFMAVMDEVAAALCKEVSGTVFSYQESDEISLLVTDFGSVHTEAWFGGTVQKMASIAASVATVEFNYRAAASHRSLVDRIPNFMGTFDGRAFTIPSAVEVANYFLWRQRDCVRNSVSMAAQAHFPHKQLHGLNGSQMQELLWAEKGVNWNDYPDGAKRGRICQRVTGEEDVTYTDKRSGEEVSTRAMRSHWVPSAAPHFTAEPGSFLAEVIPSLPSLDRERVSV
jgi:tRNA(His) guanylyltransferase